ncbi:MAG: NYN domain-containing protein [Geminicoccaceae bacterium]
MFIDGPTIYQTCRSLDVDIDYRALCNIFADAGYLVQARYYTSILDDQSYSPIRPLIDWLSYNGFVVVTRTIRAGQDVDDSSRLDRGIGIELAVDVIEMASRLDHAVLFTGNGDFVRLVQLLQRRTVRTTVVGTLHGASSMVSDELRRQADTFVDLRALVPFIGKERHRLSELREAG